MGVSASGNWLSDGRDRLTIRLHKAPGGPGKSQPVTTMKDPLVDDDNLAEMNLFRRSAFVAVAVSTVTILGCIMLIPLAYQNVQRIHSHLLDDAHFCKIRNRDLWSEVVSVSSNRGERAMAARAKRGLDHDGKWLFGHFITTQPNRERSRRQNGKYAAAEGEGAQVAGEPTAEAESCCGCSTGPAGPAGDSGADGDDGKDGAAGTDGAPGLDAEVSYNEGAQAAPACVRECPTGPAGPAGTPGDKGPRGYPGEMGEPGSSGKPGEKGSAGRMGPAGPPGYPGRPGEKGDNGKSIPGDAPPGPPGRAGEMGVSGPPGPPGDKGKPGAAGPPGPAGDMGNPGSYGKPGPAGAPGSDGHGGEKGGCDHCPPPRTPPGY